MGLIFCYFYINKIESKITQKVQIKSKNCFQSEALLRTRLHEKATILDLTLIQKMI